jgi:spore coat protein H
MPKLFGWLPKRRWLRWLIIAVGSGFLLLVALGVTGYILLQQPAIQSRVMSFMFTYQLGQEPPVPPAPSLSAEAHAQLANYGGSLKSASQLFATTNVWSVHLKFTDKEWKSLGPNRITPVPGFMGGDGRIQLNNPEASRPGLAGVLGIDFPWSQVTAEFGGRTFTNVAIRFKGNGTFLSAMSSYKRPYKLELNEHVKGQKLGGIAKLNFGNLLAENSMLTDTMGYEFYREAGVPTIRTAFARVLLSIDGRFDGRALGLFLLVEDPDGNWAEEAVGTEGVAVFKPVTYELFHYRGDDWIAYERDYNPKTDVTEEQQQRVIALARLCSQADDADFAAKIAEFVDLAEFATWLACETTLSNYDGFYTTGQNYLMYLDPRSNRFGFSPWDLDHSWGEFPFVGTADQRERASIWHPWTGENRFLERLLKHEPFRELYRNELERLQATLFQPARLNARLDELASIIRPFVAEESNNRLAKFEACITSEWSEGSRDGDPMDPNRPPYPLKRFFEARAKSIQAQLSGEEEGLRMPAMGKP